MNRCYALVCECQPSSLKLLSLQKRRKMGPNGMVRIGFRFDKNPLFRFSP